MKTLTLFLSALMLWGYSLSAAADPSCEGRFVNPITDVCWRCIFPCRSAACRLVKAICLIPAIRVVPCSCVRRRHRFLFDPALAIGYWEPMAMTDVSRSPAVWSIWGLQYQSRQDRYGDREKGRQAGERRFYHVHWYKYPLTYWLNIITSAGCLEGGDMDIAYLSGD